MTLSLLFFLKIKDNCFWGLWGIIYIRNGSVIFMFEFGSSWLLWYEGFRVCVGSLFYFVLKLLN